MGVVVLLAGLAVIQSFILVDRWSGRGPEAAGVRAAAAGDTLHKLTGMDGRGREVVYDWNTSPSGWTVLLAFSSTCPFTNEVAPLWRDRLAEPHAADMLLVTGDAAASGRDFAVENGWEVDMVAVDPRPFAREIGLDFVTRTPWFYVVDREGVIRLEGHGALIDRALAFVASR